MEQLTRAEIEEIVIHNAGKAPNYREALLKDPKRVVEMQLNNKLPENLEVKIVEEGPNTIYLRLPYQIAQGQELSDADLEKVAGGKGSESYTCDSSTGGFNTRNEFSAEVSII